MKTKIANGLKSITFFLIISVFFNVFMSDVITKNVFAAQTGTSEIVIDTDSGRVLYENNADQKREIASTTKIVTAITVIENFDVSKNVCVKKEWTNVEGSSVYLREGENLTVEELLYALMLRSGNDCAVTLACALSENIENFCLKMNETAKKAGAESSNFLNPHGLSEKNHYSTARDLAYITAYALKNELFAKIVSTKKIKIGNGESTRVLINKNKLLSNYEYATGVKTGYTKNAGRCLVSSATKNGFNLVCVVLNCGPMFERSEELFNETYCDFKRVLLAEKQQILTYAKVKNKKLYLPLGTNEDLYYPLKQSELNDVKIELNVYPLEKIPIDCKKEMGTIKISLKNRLLFDKKIYTII